MKPSKKPNDPNVGPQQLRELKPEDLKHASGGYGYGGYGGYGGGWGGGYSGGYSGGWGSSGGYASWGGCCDNNIMWG